MASRKADIHIGDLTEHQQAAGQLRIGEQVTISQAEGSSSFTVHSASGQHLGLITEAADRELLLSGTAVVRSIRRQEGTVVQVLLRVTQAPPAPKPAPGESSGCLVSLLYAVKVARSGFRARGGPSCPAYQNPVGHTHDSICAVPCIFLYHSDTVCPGGWCFTRT